MWLLGIFYTWADWVHSQKQIGILASYLLVNNFQYIAWNVEPNTLCGTRMFNMYLQPYYMLKTNFFLLQFLFLCNLLFSVWYRVLKKLIQEGCIIGTTQEITSNEFWASYFCENYQPICVTILTLMMCGVIFTDMGALTITVYSKDLFILTDALTLKVVITKLRFHEGWFETLAECVS